MEILAVAVPHISYGSTKSIPGTKVEVESIKSTLSPSGAQINTLIEEQATSSNVLQRLSTSSIVHFACHGVQEPYDTVRSALLLFDQPLPLTKIATSIANAGVAPLVVLSACSTARGDITLQDESMHIAAAFMFIGFRGAVATLWSIDDRDAPLVFREFYSYISKRGTAEIDLSDASRALEHAVDALRRTGVELERWLPFVHLGM
jgi:CHAT domain-containing protein